MLHIKVKTAKEKKTNWSRVYDEFLLFSCYSRLGKLHDVRIVQKIPLFLIFVLNFNLIFKIQTKLQKFSMNEKKINNEKFLPRKKANPKHKKHNEDFARPAAWLITLLRCFPCFLFFTLETLSLIYNVYVWKPRFFWEIFLLPNFC